MLQISDSVARYPSLKDKRVFITGGGTGIGAHMVERFSQQGAQVSFVDIAEPPSQSLCEKLAGKVAHTPVFIPCDIRNIASLVDCIEEIYREQGDIGVLINNAADDTRHDLETLSVEYWDDRMAVNLRPCFFAAQAVIPQMQRLGGGSIINLGSISWRLKQGCMPAYTTAKAAIEGLTRTLAGRHGEDNIRVNSLIPGWVMTERQLTRWLDADTVKDIHHHQCIKKTLVPDDIVNTALFLAADDSNMLTSQSIIVDGGWV
ncbi:SDR family NAD(P)-dependent oxidoreductase [Lacimicrobium alkaliphilum]|uniref:3-oxoacyl-ACP reductase n=1 Tax=Lacimicrobium alkaliphilum TaxID=1526571 RepID=A0ABQ1R041_9ALTE|nr:SDR family oxidoreductase [Lacimicrobium alkaliphilum]GGD51750.1 3-oxoacyl-ACP reductase [Lacimicrobium alkaliphilum]